MSREKAIERIEELEAENERFAEDFDKALSWARDAHKEAIEHRDRMEELEAELDCFRDEIEQEIADLRERTDLLSLVDDIDQADGTQKAAMCIQMLAEDAGRDGRAEMTAREGWNALQRSVDRTSMYDLYREAEGLVDGTVVEFEKRSGQTPSVLMVDRSKGPLPRKYRGGGR
jgi:DNA repair exonuclease SbcCD ATPase subunit